MEDVIGLSLKRRVSLKPAGADVFTVHVLNRGSDGVLKAAAAARGHGSVSVVTAELASIIDPEHDERVEDDVDEGLWEEMETGLRHHGRITANFLLLMALGGAICAVGLVSDPAPQAIAFVASAIIAPGYEPIVKIPLGLVLRRWHVAWRGLQSALIGYAVLIGAAALALLLMRAFDSDVAREFVTNPEVKHLAHPTVKEVLTTTCAAAAGAIIVAAYRRSVIAGPLVALVIIPAAAKAGMALALGRGDLVGEGLERLGLDVLLIIGLGGLVFGLKQGLVHRRRSLI